MGSCTSCCQTATATATIIDVDGNFRQVKVPITAAELMLANPGHLISSTDNLRRSLRYEAMPADRQLLPGKLYMFVPASKLRCKLDRAKLESVYKRKSTKQRSSKVLPSTTGERSVPSLGENVTGYKPVWRPILEPICEGICYVGGTNY